MNTPAHKPELWQFRWLNPSGEPQPASVLEWKIVEPLWNQTVEQKCAELLAFRYKGKPMYEVRGLYAHSPFANSEQTVVIDRACFERGCPCHDVGDKDAVIVRSVP